jgi:hypothetical protein
MRLPRNLLGLEAGLLLLSVPVFAQWQQFESVDPIDDSTTTGVLVRAEVGENYLGEKHVLVFRRHNGEFVTFVSVHDYLGSGRLAALYRLGTDEAIRVGMSASSDGTAAFFFPEDGYHIRSQLLEYDRIVIRIALYDHTTVTSVFDVSGLGDYIAEHPDLQSFFTGSNTQRLAYALDREGVRDIVKTLLLGEPDSERERVLQMAVSGETPDEIAEHLVQLKLSNPHGTEQIPVGLSRSSLPEPTGGQLGWDMVVDGEEIEVIYESGFGTLLLSPESVLHFDPEEPDDPIIDTLSWR